MPLRSRQHFAATIATAALALLLASGASRAAPSEGNFPAPQADFAEHRQAVWQFIAANPLPGRSPEAVALNLPFELAANADTAYRGKFLLFHGLSDSPFVWRDMAREIADRGFDVRAVLLPGHGTTPEDFLDLSWRQWLSAARSHLRFYDDGDTPIYLGGFSLGGVLATILALENPDIAGLLLFSPAYRSKLDRYLRWSEIYAWFKPWLFGGMILEDNPIKYNSIPINSGAQFYKTTRYLRKQWGDQKLRMPVLMVVTQYDSVVDIDYVRRVFSRRFKSPDRTLLLYSHEPDIDLNEGETIRPDQFPDRRLLNQSHLSMMNAPDNPLFGASRRVLVCNGNEYPIFMACMGAENHWYGAQHTESPDGTPVARTTYNPDFAGVLAAFDRVFSDN